MGGRHRRGFPIWFALDAHAVPDQPGGSPAADDLVASELQALRDLRYFKAVNEINRDAHYPESFARHGAAVLFLAVVEWAATQYAFSHPAFSMHGGTLFLSLLITVINLVVAWTIGYLPTRQRNHRDPAVRNTAKLIVAGYWLLLIVGHLMVAHYRDVSSAGAQATLSASVHSVLADPLEMSMAATMLLVVGVVAALLCQILGLRADDPYPAYGHHHRAYLRKRQARERAGVSGGEETAVAMQQQQ